MDDLSLQHRWFERLSAKRRVLAEQLHDPAAAGFWNMVVDKYAAQAHFIYELLQNADDACAAYAEISLTPQGVFFVHNGSIHFSVTDPDLEADGVPSGHINALTSIGASSKLAENSIGKFGIGFKSVFMYTDCPHIEDDNFSFSINDFIVPVADNRIANKRRSGETLFFLPFKSQSQNLYAEVANCLRQLRNPLLFLRHLSKLDWHIESENLHHSFSADVWHSEIFETGRVGEVHAEFLSLGNGQYCHRFSALQSAGGSFNSASDVCSVIYFSDADGKPVLPDGGMPLVHCFFPLEEVVSCTSVLVHAPFLLSENRERIKRYGDWNLHLSHVVSLLSAEALSLLCRLSEDGKFHFSFGNLLDFVPLSKSANYVDADFYASFVDVLGIERVFLTSDGSYVSASQTAYAESKGLIDFLGDFAFSHLIPGLADKGWCFLSLYQNQNIEQNNVVRQQLVYLRSNGLISVSVSSSDVPSHLSSSFIKGLSVDELLRLYAFLAAYPSLFSPKSELLNAPFVLCSDGVVRAPYKDGNPQIFIGENLDSALPSVDNALMADSAVQKMVQLLKLKAPDVQSQIGFYILPSYRNLKVEVADFQTIASHLQIFAEAFSGVSYLVEQRDAFLSQFTDVAFLPVKFGNRVGLSTPSGVYFHTDDLAVYFRHGSSVKFLCPEVMQSVEPAKRDAVYYFLTALGLSFTPRILSVQVNPAPDVLSYCHLSPVSLRQRDNGGQIIVDKVIDGFESFIASLSLQSSMAFIRLLGKMVNASGAFVFSQGLKGSYTYYPKAKKNPTEESFLYTTAYQSIFHQAWLYLNDGSIVKPAEVADSGILSADYDIQSSDSFLLLFLGIAYKDPLQNLSAEQKKSVLLMKKLERAGFSAEVLDGLASGKYELRKIKDE